jgi:hypothetical protein
MKTENPFDTEVAESTETMRWSPRSARAWIGKTRTERGFHPRAIPA